jgi:hypothetical protein
LKRSRAPSKENPFGSEKLKLFHQLFPRNRGNPAPFFLAATRRKNNVGPVDTAAMGSNSFFKSRVVELTLRLKQVIKGAMLRLRRE